MNHAHTARNSNPCVVMGFRITDKQHQHQLAVMTSSAVRWWCLEEAADQAEMRSEGRRGFLGEFPWDEPGRWRREGCQVVTMGYEELAL